MSSLLGASPLVRDVLGFAIGLAVTASGAIWYVRRRLRQRPAPLDATRAGRSPIELARFDRRSLTLRIDREPWARAFEALNAGR